MTGLLAVMKRNFLFLIPALLACCTAVAQKGQISIDQDPQLLKLLHIYRDAKANADYYTIQVGFGSYDYAEELQEEVSLEFPEYDPQIVFDSPTYRVHIGKFRSRLEAEKKFLEVRRKFPGALLLRPGTLER